MTTYTRTMLANEALSILLVVGAGQTADSEDLETVDNKIDALFADLQGRGVCTVSDDEDIDEAWFLTLGELLANACARNFGRTPMTDDERETVENRLRIIVNSGPMNKLQTDPALTHKPYGLSLARWRSGTF